jgi:hypothetical protein
MYRLKDGNSVCSLFAQEQKCAQDWMVGWAVNTVDVSTNRWQQHRAFFCTKAEGCAGLVGLLGTAVVGKGLLSSVLHPPCSWLLQYLARWVAAV